jgi:mannitol-1-phosphate 5-dehydrogenase
MSNQLKNILIWGAGKIGRGFIADLFNKAEYNLVFVDSNRELIHQLNTQQQYTIINLPSLDEKEEVIIKDFQAFHTDEKDQIFQKLKECSILSLVVFPSAFEQVAKDISAIIERRSREKIDRSLDILMSTNICQPSEQFKHYLFKELSDAGKDYFNRYIGLVDTLIIRMGIEPTPEMREKDPMIILTNGYPELTLDRPAFKGEPPQFNGLLYTTNMAHEEKRKMYTYNTIHAVYAYLGKQRGYQYIIESIQDEEIQQMAVEGLKESSRALQKEFGYSDEEMKEWNNRVLKNMANPILKDKIDRVGADPIRKLKKEDRLIGPALMCIRNGILPYFLAKTAAAALLFTVEDDPATTIIQKFLRSHPIKEAVREFCQLDREVELIQLIAEQYQKFLNKISLKEDFYKIKKLKDCYEIGFEYEKNYRGCAQCLISTIFKFTGKNNNSLFQSASGLSGGMALCGDGACGGYSGGIMIMGSFIGRRFEMLEVNGDKEAQSQAYQMAQRLHDKFIETYGSVICADIHKQIFGKSFCLRSKEVRKEFEEAGAHLDKCTTVVAMAASWVADILSDEGFL